MATLTKFGWFDTQDDNHVFRTITDDIGQFLQGSIDHCIIGIKILAELVSLINQVIDFLSYFFNFVVKFSCSSSELFLFLYGINNRIFKINGKQYTFITGRKLPIINF